MENYKYIAWDSAGIKKEGFRQANSHNDIITWLRQTGLTPVSVEAAFKKTTRKKVTSRRKRIKSAELASFCWQLATMIQGGVPLTEAITTIKDDIDNTYLQYILSDMADNIRRGKPISQVTEKYPWVFDNLFNSMIIAGEHGGALAESLHRLATYLDNRDKLIHKVKTALAYPIFVAAFVVFIVVMMMVLIIPRFQVMFDNFKGELPMFTKGFMGFYNSIVNNLPIIIAGLAALMLLGIIYGKTKTGHKNYSSAILKLPLIGKIISMAFLATFCRTMSTLLKSGVPVLESITILSDMTANDIIAGSVKKLKEKIVEGNSVAQAMIKSGFFPNLTVKMTQVGEHSGSLSEVMEKTAEHYERKVDRTITTLTTILEPALIITVGAIVLVVLLALYLPIFSMSEI